MPKEGRPALIAVIIALAVLCGLWNLFSGFVGPAGYTLGSASAIQVTQVYTEAMYRIMLGIAGFVVAIFCAVVARNVVRPAPPTVLTPAPRPASPGRRAPNKSAADTIYYTCPTCNEPVRADQKFCDNCGETLAPMPDDQ